MNKEPISILVTAYKTADYIEDCLNSISKQTYFKNFNEYEILIGIDDCKKTLDKLISIMDNYKNLNIFMMDSNMGTYVTTNTLINISKYDNLIRFDSDDIMKNNMVSEIMKNHEKYDIIRFKCTDINKNGELLNVSVNSYVAGAMYYKKKIFKKYGGYKPWVCASDSNLLKRIGCNESILLNDNRLFLRRVRDDSLTMTQLTNMKSKIREKYHNETKISTDVFVNMITNTYTKIEKK